MSEFIDAHKPQPIFYGYILIGYSFLIGFLASSFFLHSRGIFFPMWMEEFSVGRTEISLVITLTLFTGSCLAPVIGFLIDRYPIKLVSFVGACWMATGYLLLQWVDSYFAFALVLICFQGVAWGTLGPLVQTKLMVNWFNRNRGVALGFAIMGISVAGIMMPTVATFMAESFGWRNTYIFYALTIFLIIVPATIILVKQDPAAIGVHPDGDKSAPEVVEIQKSETNLQVYKEFLTSNAFWSVVLTFGMMNGVYSAMITHLPSYLTIDLGFSLYDASYALGVAGGFAILGKIVFGWLMDHFDAKVTVMLAVISYLFSQLILIIAVSYPPLLLASGLFGMAFGAMIPVRSVVLSRLFGVEKFSRVNGLLTFFLAPATFWTVFAGYIADHHGYQTIFQIWAVAFLLAGLVTMVIKLPNRA